MQSKKLFGQDREVKQSSQSENEKLIKIGDLKILPCKQVYKPSDDTFLIFDYLSSLKPSLKNEQRKALDLGTGTGVIAVLLAKKGFTVTATDINPKSGNCLKLNASINKVARKITFKLGNLFEPVKKEKFDLITFNPPYLPIKPNKGDYLSLAWSGGCGGREIIDTFLEKAPSYLRKKGKIVFVHSSLNNLEKTLEICKKVGIKCKVLREKKFFFETLYLITGKPEMEVTLSKH